MKPLEGIRILDLTRVLAGPFCTALMADLGAEVIKLEPPQGDDHRHIGPFVEGESALFALTNRGKQSLVVNLKSEEGQSLVRRFETVAMSWWKTSVPAYDTVVQAMSGLMDATGEEGGAPCHRQGDPDPRRLRVYPRFPARTPWSRPSHHAHLRGLIRNPARQHFRPPAGRLRRQS